MKFGHLIVISLLTGCAGTSQQGVAPSSGTGSASTSAGVSKEALKIAETLISIRMANADLCPGTFYTTAAGLSSGHQQYRPYEVVNIWEGGPAAKRGLQVGDRIAAINGISTEDPSTPDTEYFKLENQEQIFTVERNGEMLDIAFQPAPVCNFNLFNVVDDSQNFYARVNFAQVNTGALAFARNQDEFALMAAHAFAHLALQHTLEPPTGTKILETVAGSFFEAAFGAAGAPAVRDARQAVRDTVGPGTHSEAEQRAADYLTAYVMARAGHDPAVSVQFWERLEAAHATRSIPAMVTHESYEGRSAEIARAVAEVTRKQAAGETLVPDYAAFQAGG